MNRSRQLAALMITEIVGFPDMERASRTEAQQLLQHFKTTLERINDKYYGKTVRFSKEAAFVVFESTILSVQGGLELQKVCLQAPQIPLRIGIHFGEFEEKGNTIEGQAVDITDQIKAKGETGSILVSALIATELKHHDYLHFHSLGQHYFKETSKAIELFALADPALRIPETLKQIAKTSEAQGNDLHPFLQQLHQIIEANLNDSDFAVSTLCQELGLSHSSLHRKLNELTGLSVKKFIQQVRFNKARALLQNTDQTVAAIAYDIGFKDADYFYRVFKRHFGVTPKEFRKNPERIAPPTTTSEASSNKNQSEQDNTPPNTSSKNNLPHIITSFLGREKELSELKTMLLQGNRLITLVGPGGIGKTRLLIQTAKEVEQQFPDGVYWIPLSEITDPGVVPFTIARHINLNEDILQSIEEVLIQFFQHKKALLVLDNFEQIVDASTVVRELIESTNNLHIIVSSRVILQINGEIEYPVPPLEIPEAADTTVLEQVEKISAVALFSQRAQISRRRFQLTEENITTVAEICQRLDGLPLAIELAAARTKIFSPRMLLGRLKNSLDILKGGDQFPERHQTLRQTIAWSYDLLEVEEQELFRRNAVFVGGSTIDAIEQICGQNGLSDWDIVDGVMALVDKSLIQIKDTEEPRFFMLETIREYAVESLEQSEKSTALKKAHIDYYLELAEQATSQLSGPDSKYWNTKLLEEQANLRAAIDYALHLGEIEKAYRIGVAMRPFWGFRGMIQEGIQLLEKLLAVPVDQAFYGDRLKVLGAVSMLYIYIPDFQKAIEIFQESLSYWRRQKDKRQIGLALNNLGWSHAMVGSYHESKACSLEARNIFETELDKRPLVGSLTNLGWLNMNQGRPLDAIPYFIQTINLTSQFQDQRRNGYATAYHGFCQYSIGAYQKGEALLRRSLTVGEEISDKILRGFSHMILGFIYYAIGDFDQCEDSGLQAVDLGSQMKTSFIIGGGYENHAAAALGRGTLEQAKRWGEKAMNIFQDQIKTDHWMNRSAHTLGKIAVGLRDLELAKATCSTLLSKEIEEESYLGFIPGLEIAARIGNQIEEPALATQLLFNALAIREKLGTPTFESEASSYQNLMEELKNNLGERKFEELKVIRSSEQELFEMANQILRT